MRRLNVVSLVFGLLLTSVACVALWLAIFGTVDWQGLRIGAPMLLVLVGVLGLTLSRNRG